MGLQRSLYQVDEDDGVVEVCISVYSPKVGCPVTYPFTVVLTSVAFSAGKHVDFSVAWVQMWNVDFNIIFILSGSHRLCANH